MTQLQALREFAAIAIGERVVIARYRMDGNWGMDVYGKQPRLIIPYVIDYTPEEVDIAFRENFIARCPIAEAFSDVTLAILHELGHWATRKEVDWSADYEIRKEVPWNEYYDIHSEYIATEWAIAWLIAHTETARQFERTFFGE